MGRRARDTRRTARLQRASLTATNPGPGVRLRNSVHNMIFSTVSWFMSWCGAARAASLSLRVSRVTRRQAARTARDEGDWSRGTSEGASGRVSSKAGIVRAACERFAENRWQGFGRRGLHSNSRTFRVASSGARPPSLGGGRARLSADAGALVGGRESPPGGARRVSRMHA